MNHLQAGWEVVVALKNDLVALSGPIHLRACVSEERGDGEGEGSYRKCHQIHSDTSTSPVES